MRAVNDAIQRLEKKARDPKAIMLGIATDLQVIACALCELRDAIGGKADPPLVIDSAHQAQTIGGTACAIKSAGSKGNGTKS